MIHGGLMKKEKRMKINWIETKKQLPGFEKRIMVYGKRSNVQNDSNKIWIGYYSSRDIRGDWFKIYDNWNSQTSSTLDITHWAELPECPKD